MQLSLFDDRDMAEISAPDFPGECWSFCRNPDLAAERARKCEDLLAATETDLAKIRAATTRTRNPLRGEAEIALKVGAVLGRRKVAKHFKLTITEETLKTALSECAAVASLSYRAAASFAAGSTTRSAINSRTSLARSYTGFG